MGIIVFAEVVMSRKELSTIWREPLAGLPVQSFRYDISSIHTSINLDPKIHLTYISIYLLVYLLVYLRISADGIVQDYGNEYLIAHHESHSRQQIIKR